MAQHSSTPRVVIVGAGFSALCLAIHLKKAGIDTFTVLEKNDGLGGTWRENTYPGAACDVPSFSYCFSFEQKSDWTRKWSPQWEILEYMQHCADKYGVTPHIRFGTEVESAGFDAGKGQWTVRTRAGEKLTCEILVSGVGQLNRPNTPEIAGRNAFRGEQFHSARWNHDYDLTGKRVGVIGNAASAIQFIPQIAPQVEQLYVFQRTANWMIPRGDRAYSEKERQRFTRHPWLARLYRWMIWALYESGWPLFRGNRMSAAAMRRTVERFIDEHIRDPELRNALIPDYPPGAKRLLISDDYYAALARSNVELVTDGIERFSKDAIVTNDGAARRIDCAIFATGFRTTEFLTPMTVVGPDGTTLEEAWRKGAEAYLGISVAGFPNFFMMYGPNTNLGHNSIIFMIECQTAYIMDLIAKMRAAGAKSFDLRADVQKSYNERLQRQLARTVWTQIDASWYKNAAGRVTNNWSGTTIAYWWKTRHADQRLYDVVSHAQRVAADLPTSSPGGDRAQRSAA